VASEPAPNGGPTRFDRAAEIFHEVRSLGLVERDERLSVLCKGDAELEAMVRLLLKGDNAPLPAEALADQIKAAGDAVTSGIASELIATRIGHYKLLERIGEGGFGIVHLAEQEQPVRRLVALKIIKLGMDTRQVVARFEAERQALAIMDHPNIAKVFDGGATDSGRPYFVMELVKGVPITEYCDERRLTLTARLELFRQVCDALQHAHQKGVIHRDIKPSNILVGEIDGRPVPKVIDFGIAKATSAHLTEKTICTEHRQMIGTPEYMSPEQAGAFSLDIDTRTDVYSLGVLLYELLTGATPFDSRRLRSAAYGEIQRIIREEDPPRPSTRLTLHESRASIAAARGIEPARLTSQLAGELDWVVMKAMEKDRTRRYDSAGALMRDVDRFIAGEAVQAVPPSLTYRIGKFVKRHKLPVFGAVNLLLVLVAGLVGTSLGFWNAEKEREVAVANGIRADLKATEAIEQRRIAERSSYIATMKLAIDSIESAHPGRASILLDQCSASYRGWEWRHARSLLTQSSRRIDSTTVPGLQGRTLSTTPDGNLVLVAARSPETGQYGVVLIDTNTGREVRRILGHTSELNSLRLDPTGTLILTASADGTARIFRLSDGREVAIPFRADTSVEYAEFDHTGTRVLVLLASSPSVAAYAIVCNADGSGMIGTPLEGPLTVCFEPGSGRVIFTRGFQPPGVWDPESGATQPLHTEQSSEARPNHAGDLVAANTNDMLIRLIERPAGRVRASLRGHWAVLHAIEFATDREMVYSTSEDQTIRSWSTITGDPIRTFLGHTTAVFDIAIAPDGRRVYSIGGDGIRFWNSDPEADGLVLHAKGEYQVRGLCYSPDGTLLATSSADQGLTIWNTATNQPVRKLLPAMSHRCRISGDGKILIATTWSDALHVWNLTSGEQLLEATQLPGGVCDLAVNHDGTRLAFSFWEREGLLLDEHGAPIAGFNGLEAKSRALAFIPGSNELVAELPANGTFARWDATNGARLPHSPVVANVVKSIQVLPGGHWLLALESDQVRIVDPSDGSTVRSFRGHASLLRGAAMLPGGSRIISTARDGTIRIWDVESGDEVASFRTMHTFPDMLAVNPITGTVAVAFEDRSVQIFHAPE